MLNLEDTIEFLKNHKISCEMINIGTAYDPHWNEESKLRGIICSDGTYYAEQLLTNGKGFSVIDVVFYPTREAAKTHRLMVVNEDWTDDPDAMTDSYDC